MKLTAEQLIEQLNIINPDEEIRILDSYIPTAREFLTEMLTASDMVYRYDEKDMSVLLSTLKSDKLLQQRLSSARDCLLSVPMTYDIEDLKALMDILEYQLIGEDTNFFFAQHQKENILVVLVA